MRLFEHCKLNVCLFYVGTVGRGTLSMNVVANIPIIKGATTLPFCSSNERCLGQNCFYAIFVLLSVHIGHRVLDFGANNICATDSRKC